MFYVSLQMYATVVNKQTAVNDDFFPQKELNRNLKHETKLKCYTRNLSAHGASV